jgi:hypothetical protein
MRIGTATNRRPQNLSTRHAPIQIHYAASTWMSNPTPSTMMVHSVVRSSAICHEMNPLHGWSSEAGRCPAPLVMCVVGVNECGCFQASRAVPSRRAASPKGLKDAGEVMASLACTPQHTTFTCATRCSLSPARAVQHLQPSQGMPIARHYSHTQPGCCDVYRHSTLLCFYVL